mmetsp:Transcript_12664/g.38795  ORF Transcript_12664/g.38795 Transcript_12664/m.38795 type:complete len:760 (-) Transcript_12664:124-2403(-)|eukprot:CAMPEP_0198724582 /NCGR_PEP_ID=MMETSP1475-20131203/2038_1 /TAXON_ID= ORGANISM="Unidentified sp., Strain CCMP1999" /NCGR_SAMPLE_ID=MMETSP1475 /ASSEMBLY_ACC=CAM_ASM_001111 /LENGTH=759 /DNA_ID=CAMNT_0044486155 /DNA_START=189 /DNA_END=2468 /DNA_ORIENTATION=+
MALMSAEKHLATAGLPVVGWPKLTARLTSWFLVLLMLLFIIVHRVIKLGDGRTWDAEAGEYKYYTDDLRGVWRGSNWFDVLFGTILWAPFGLIVLAAVCLDRRGNNDVLSALNSSFVEQECSKTAQTLSRVRRSLWRPRYVVGRSWYRTVWSNGDIVLCAVLAGCNLVWFLGLSFRSNVMYASYLADFEGKRLRLNKLYSFAFYSAWAGMMNAGAAIVFTARENHLSKVALGGEYFHGLKYHIGLGYLSLAFFTFHSWTILFLEIYLFEHNLYEALNPTSGWLGHTNFWGLIAWISLTIMALTSLYYVRRKFYRVFYWSHQFYILFLFAAIVHFPSSLYPIVAAVLLFTYDRVSPRLSVPRRHVATIARVTDEIVRVDVALTKVVNPEYAPGDWVNLKVPDVDRVNWHPFSIGSHWATCPDRYTFFIKSRGKWTQQLHKLVPTVGGHATLSVYLDGVFGTRSRTYLAADGLVVVGAGTGIAAVAPYALQYALVRPDRPVKVLWIARCVEDVAIYTELLSTMQSLQMSTGLEINLYLTRESKRLEDECNAAAAIDMDGQDDMTTSDGIEESPETASGDVRVAPVRDDITLVVNYVFKISAVFAVFAVGIFTFFWVRAAEGEGMVDRCWDWGSPVEEGSDELMTLTPLEKFKCFYLPAFAILTACLLGAALTLVLALVQTRLFSLKADVFSTLPKPVSRQNFTLGWTLGRPDVSAYIASLAKGDRETWNVLAAGPERLVEQVENVAISTPHVHFSRESWKV